MITETFDNETKAIINPDINKDAYKADACILTFSYKIEKFVLEHYECEKIGEFYFATGCTPIYKIDYKGKKFTFYKTYVGAPACVGSVESTLSQINTKKYIVFGGAGCLNKEITHGKIMIPTEAYRDEGTSYHYARKADYIKIKNADTVAEFMKKNNIPFIKGKTWTTDAFYRETQGNFERHKKDGCISVEMECSALQAMCDFRNLELYMFFSSGDLLDAPKWTMRHDAKNEDKGTKHDAAYFDIALNLADYLAVNSVSV